MPSLFSSCFGRGNKETSALLSSPDDSSTSHTSPPAGQRAVDSVNPAQFIFCNVTADRFNMVTSDDKYICFTDR